MRVRCNHAEGWTYPVPGEQRCRTCGTVRFTDYGALRPPGLPPGPRWSSRAGSHPTRRPYAAYK
ncbi:MULTISPECIES: DUF6255 family natural product biosynthesis protein [Streptomyces]|uniref:DUF6255 family natural product biosynthesis protein n=1 Tax=Streptomyces TaxID=1883 RepID=UPI00345C5BC5